MTPPFVNSAEDVSAKSPRIPNQDTVRAPASNARMKTRRPAALAFAIGGVIAALLGALGILHAIAPDAEALRAALSLEIDRIEALPPGDPVQKDRRIEELLAVEDYRKYARSLQGRLERLHGPAHQAARADTAARQAVPPFLRRCRSLEGRSPEELRTLDDEARSLQNEHGSTRFGPALGEVRSRLAETSAAAAPRCTEVDHFRLSQEAEKDRIEGRFASALRRIDDAIARHPACVAFLGRVKQDRGTLFRSAAQAAEKLLEQAQAARGDGRKDEAARALDRALPNYKGLPEEGRLTALLAELRRN